MSIQQNNTEKRLARLEAVSNQIKSEMDDVLENAYRIACDEQDEERAAELARKIRNKLLYESDKHFTLDSMLPEAPTGISFSDWLHWLKELASIASNAWAKYRQALRDLPQQEGFPFNVVFPKSPDHKEDNEI